MPKSASKLQIENFANLEGLGKKRNCQSPQARAKSTAKILIISKQGEYHKRNKNFNQSVKLGSVGYEKYIISPCRGYFIWSYF
jgi:hypothetical protein